MGGKPTLDHYSVPRSGGHQAVVLQEAVAVGTERKGRVAHLGVFERLLHSAAQRVVVVLGLDDRQWDVMVIEDVVGELTLTPRGAITSGVYLTSRDVLLLADLG